MNNPASSRQGALVRTLYRKMLRECERIPPSASLLHLNQKWACDDPIKDREALRTCLRTSFRRNNVASSDSTNTDKNGRVLGEEKGIQDAMEGLKVLLSFDPSSTIDASQIAGNEPIRNEKFGPGDRDRDPSGPSWTNSDALLESVEWLPCVSEMKDVRGVDEESLLLPVFPLAGPLFLDGEGKKLPLLSQFSEVPVAGMEMSLRIFEPRYREMYQDLLSSPDQSSRRFVVPFSHPYRSGQFAALGWMYEISGVRDVADQFNGKIQLECNHVVSNPVRILELVNPTEHGTQSTYLRARADILSNNEPKTDEKTGEEGKEGGPTDLLMLEEMLQKFKKDPQSPSFDNPHQQMCLIDRLLIAIGEGSVWPVAQAWLSHLQVDILRLQAKISTRIQLQATAEQKRSTGNYDGVEWQGLVTEEMVLLAQEPYKHNLRCMLIEVSTLVPMLLQQQSHRHQCYYIYRRIREHIYRRIRQRMME